MNVALVTAAALSVLLAAGHSYLGERYILMRLLRRDNVPQLFGSDWFTKRTLRFAWHLTSIAWLGLAAVLLAVAGHPLSVRASVLQVVSGTFAVSGVVTAAASRGKHLAWIAFLILAALVWSAS